MYFSELNIAVKFCEYLNILDKWFAALKICSRGQKTECLHSEEGECPHKICIP